MFRALGVKTLRKESVKRKMSNNPWLYWSTFAFLLWIGVWTIYGKVRSYRLSGFTFYLISGLITGVPFMVLAILFLISVKVAIFSFIFILFISRFGALWGESQEKIASQTEAEKWQEWQKKEKS
jgi:ABC-type arginine transport system permease subunit